MDMIILAGEPEKRKVLSIRKVPDNDGRPRSMNPHYVNPGDSVYMVFNPNGDMPKRVYPPEERGRAIDHAKLLAAKEGTRVFVLRAWRAFEPEQGS